MVVVAIKLRSKRLHPAVHCGSRINNDIYSGCKQELCL